MVRLRAAPRDEPGARCGGAACWREPIRRASSTASKAPRSAFALYDSDLPEIRSIAAARDGAIYFAAMGGGMERMLQSVQAAQAAAQQAAAPQSPAVKAGAAPAQAAAAQTSATVSFAQPTVSYGLERAAVLRLQPGPGGRETLVIDGRKRSGTPAQRRAGARKRFSPATAARRIYEIDPRRRLSIAAQTDRPQITAYAANRPRRAARLRARRRLAAACQRAGAERGSFETAAYDSGGVSRWGRLCWQGRRPRGRRSPCATRSGNSYRPDATWCPWSAAAAEAEDAAVASPAARFIQWQATLTAAPCWTRLRLTYLPQNSRPVVKSISVLPEAADTDAANGDEARRLRHNQQLQHHCFGFRVGFRPPSAARKPWSWVGGPRRKLAVSWQAEDPDGDALRAAVAFRGEGETRLENDRAQHRRGPS